jgi:hypothetical protein
MASLKYNSCFIVAVAACRMPLVIQSLLPPSSNKSNQLYCILLTAVPFCLAAICQMLTSWHSHKRNERRWHLVAFWLLGGVSLALLPLPQMTGSRAGAFALLTLGVVSVYGVEGISISYYLALMGGEKVRSSRRLMHHQTHNDNVAIFENKQGVGAYMKAITGWLQHHIITSSQSRVSMQLTVAFWTALSPFLTMLYITQ